MGDQAHLEQLENGAIQWNEWRRQNPEVEPDLSKFDLVNIDCRKEDRARAKQYAKEQALRKPVPGVLTPIVVPLMKGSVKGRRTPLGAINFANTNLSDSNLEYCNLMDADLSGANCRNADLSYASLDRANLHDAGLYNANLRGASLRAADLSDADLARALLLNADLSGAALNGVRLRQTVFAGTNLSGAAGLTRCLHWGPSVLDSRTLELSSMLPLSFLRDCGLPEKMIENLKSILFSAREYFSCFVSYSTGDQSFTERLHADLQDSGVRCWFMQDDMLPGDRILDTIDKEVSGHERFLLILSEHALASTWVEDEVMKAFAEARDRPDLIIPIRIDDAVLSAEKAWAAKLKNTWNIGNFVGWEDEATYSSAFNSLISALRRDEEASDPHS